MAGGAGGCWGCWRPADEKVGEARAPVPQAGARLGELLIQSDLGPVNEEIERLTERRGGQQDPS